MLTPIDQYTMQQQQRRRRRQCQHHNRAIGLLLALLQSLSSTLLITPINASYLGPTHCTPPPTSLTDAISANAQDRINDKYNGIGYSSYNHVLFDLVALTSDYKSGLLHTIEDDPRLTFILCPGAIIDLDTGTLPLGFIPIEIPRIIIQCGKKGIRSMTTDESDACIIRGGGKRTGSTSSTNSAASSSSATTSTNNGMGSSWNAHPEHSYKPSIEGIIGGGNDSIAQIYVYGDTAYEVTLKGITFDNSISEDEMRLYDEYVDAGYAVDEDDEDVSFTTSFTETESFGSSTSPPPPDTFATFDLGEEVEGNVSIVFPNDEDEDNNQNNNADDTYESDVPPPPTKRRLQGGSSSGSGSGPKPSHRFASVAVRGKGYGDDAGPRLISIEDCKFVNHRGYAILVSPGIQMPVLPTAPEYNFTPSGAGGGTEEEDQAAMPTVNLQSSGQLYGDRESGGGADGVVEGNGRLLLRRLKQRWLNLLDDGGKYIPPNGSVTYYDRDVGKNYLDGRRVKISGTEFVNNIVSSDVVAGLVTSAYSLTITNCLFESNSAKSMVFVHNEDALVDDTVFVENTVEVSTVLMTSPKSKETSTTAITTSNNIKSVMPTHIVERSCFLESNVGMSNVLVTDVESAGFGQRDNHASGTEFTWSSTCEGGAAESNGNDCLESGGNCDGTCVSFTSEECLASRVAGGGGFEQYSSNGAEYGFRGVWVFGAILCVMWHSSS